MSLKLSRALLKIAMNYRIAECGTEIMTNHSFNIKYRVKYYININLILLFKKKNLNE